MSAFVDLANALISMAEADTGSGGLYNVASPLVNGVYTLNPPDGVQPPYVVIECIAQTEEKVFATTPYMVQMLIQFSIYTEKRSAAQSLTLIGTISDRLRTVYDRQTPSVTGWTSSQLLSSGAAPAQVLDAAVFQGDQYEASISK